MASHFKPKSQNMKFLIVRKHMKLAKQRMNQPNNRMKGSISRTQIWVSLLKNT